MRSLGPGLVDQSVRRQPSLLTAKPIEPVSVGTSATTIYTAREDADFWIIHLWAANRTASNVTYTLYFVPDGGTAGAGNTALFQQVLAGNTSEIIEVAINHRIPPSASIQALCSAGSGLNIGGWGYDQGGEPT